MTKQKLASEIYNISHLTGEFTLRSGIISNEYFDKYQFEAIPNLLFEISIYLKEIISFDYDILAGLEIGGIPIATALGLQIGKPMVFVRKEAKKYGTAKCIEGVSVEGKNLLIVEDVVTSGGQIIKSVEDLRKHGAIVENAVCVIDRQQNGTEKLAEVGIKLHSLFTMSELKASVI